jgi:hypothetical protein
MPRYKCECEALTIDMPRPGPAACKSCATCMTTLRTGRELRQVARPHNWITRFSERTGQPNRRVCIICNESERLPPLLTQLEERLVEAADLDEKAMRLSNFISTHTYRALPFKERSLLHLQLLFMRSYSWVLHSRIERLRETGIEPATS